MDILKIGDIVTIKKKSYKIKSLLGHGKGGYTFLAECQNVEYSLKQIHHEPCSYYNFGNKIQTEYNDYNRLLVANVLVPKMIDIDFTEEIIIKEYIEGKTIFELVKDDVNVDNYISIVRDIAANCKEKGLNIDYFPTNFVVSGGKLYYVDYECNAYSDEWNFENWGIKYWYKSKEFLDYLSNQ